MATKRLLPLLSRSSLYTSTTLNVPLHHPPRLPARHPSLLLPKFSNRHYSSSPPSPPPKRYTFEEVQSLLNSNPTSPSPSPSPSPPSPNNPRPHTLIIDVRESKELSSTGRIPGAVHMPISSNPDAIFLSPEDFEDRFGFVKPGLCTSVGNEQGMGGEEDGETEENSAATAGHGGADASADFGVGGYGGGESEGGRDGDGGEGEGGEVKEVVFYCKAGVRSRAAARMAAGEGGWKGVRVGEMGGGMDEWVGRGGGVER